MAIVSDVEIRLRADIARLQQDMTAMRRTVDNGMSAVTRSVEAAKKVLAGFGGAMLLKELASQVIGAQREFDKLNASLVTATGSSAGAAQAFGALQKFAATTPYSVAEATEAFIKLRNLGLAPSEAAMTSYGNTSAAMGKSLNQMIEAVADAATGQFERLKEFGITAKQQGDSVFLTFQGITKKIGNNSKEIQAYLRAIGDVNFNGAMEKRAATLDGAISNLGDTWDALMRKIAANGVGESMRAGTTQLGAALTDLGAILDAVGGKADKEGKAISEAGALHVFLTTTFEALAAVGVNVAYVFTAIAKDVGTFTSQVEALFNGGIKGLVDGSTLKAVTDMGHARVAEADAERKAVDEKTGAILNASKKAQTSRDAEAANAKKNSKDTLGQYEIVLNAEQRRNKADLDSMEIRNKLNGVDANTAGELKKLKTALDEGAISQAEYAKYVAKINKETVMASAAYKDGAKAIDMSTEAVKRREQAQIAANKADQEMLDYRKAMGSITEDDFITQSAENSVKALGDQKVALEAQRAILAKRYDTEAARAALTTQIEGKDKEIAAAKTKRDHDLDVADDKRYRDAITHTADRVDAAKEAALAEKAATRDLQDEVDALGLTARQLAEVTAARKMDQAAALDRRAGIGLIEEENEALRQQAEELRKQATLGLTKERVQEQQKFWGDVEQTAHDTFLAIGKDGGNLWQRLKDSAKNIFFEWLYQMTLKKWVINVGTQVDGSASVAGIAKSSSNLMGGSGSAQALMEKLGLSKETSSQLASYASNAGGMASGYMAGSALNSAISGKYETSGGVGALEKIGTAVATAYFGPIGGVVAGAISGLVNRAFGMGAKEITAQGIKGNLSAAGATGNSYSQYHQDGGWFRSDRNGTDTKSLSADTLAQFTQAFAAVESASAGFAQSLGVQADTIKDYTKAFDIKQTGDAAKDQQAIADFFNGVSDDIANKLVPSLAQFAMTGETAAQTLQRLANNANGFAQILTAMGTTSEQMFGAVGAAAIAARERVVALAGGIDALTAQTAYYTQNYITDDERAQALQKPVADALASVGLASMTTTKQYKTAVDDLVKSGKVATEEGAKQYATLMALAPQFKMVADYLAQVDAAAVQAAKDAKDAATELAAAAAEARAQSLSDNRDMLSGLVDDSLAAVGRAVDAQKNRINAAFNASMKSFDASIASVNDTISRTSALSTALKGAAMATDGGNASEQAARAQIQTALAIAKASGVLPSADDLAGALSTVKQDQSDNYSTFAEYQRAVAQTNTALESLGGLTDNQLDTAQQQLKALNDAKDAAQVQHDEDLARLDAIVAQAQAQVDAVNGVNTSVLGVAAAVAALQTILGALKAAPAATDTTGSTGGSGTTVEDLYAKVLNRAPDAEGLAFWKKAYGDSVDQTEYLDFMKAAQAELTGLIKAPPEVATVSSGTMSQSSAMQSALDTIASHMANVAANTGTTATATGQFAQQFHQVSGGGNALATEVI